MMSAVYSNFSCSPFSGVGGQCIRGNYIAYAVNASSQADILATIAFAKTHNIRFVVRNSGHEYVFYRRAPVAPHLFSTATWASRPGLAALLSGRTISKRLLGRTIVLPSTPDSPLPLKQEYQAFKCMRRHQHTTSQS
jgi:hypothetical protein